MASDERVQSTCTPEPSFGLIHFTVTKSVASEKVGYAAKSEINPTGLEQETSSHLD